MSSGEKSRRWWARASDRVTGSSWFAPAMRSLGRLGEAEVTDRAAALAYYGFLSLFPTLIVAVSVLALIGDYPETYQSISDTLHDAAPGTAVDTIDSGLRDSLSDRGRAGSLLGFGLLVAFVSGSGGTAAAIRALEAIEGRRGATGLARGWLTRIWLTLALMALLLVGFVALLVAGPAVLVDRRGRGDSGPPPAPRSRCCATRSGLLALFCAFLLLYWRGPSAYAAAGRLRRRGRARLRPLGARLGRVLALRRPFQLL